MNGEIFVQISIAVMTLIGLIITYVVSPLIKSKADAEKLSKAEYWVKIAVQAAEQVLKTHDPTGAKRKAEVLKFLAKFDIELTDEQLDTLIESAVYEINKNKDKNK